MSEAFVTEERLSDTEVRITVEIEGVRYGAIVSADGEAADEEVAEQAGEMVRNTILFHVSPDALGVESVDS